MGESERQLRGSSSPRGGPGAARGSVRPEPLHAGVVWKLSGREAYTESCSMGPVRMPPPRYQNGDTVMGRWPGSNLFYEVKVLSYGAREQLYTVIYKDGTELELSEQDIKNATGFRQRSRSRSRSPSRRRSRSRSPGRTTRRSSSRTAAAVATANITESAPPTSSSASRRSERVKEVLEVRLTPVQVARTEEKNGSNHEKSEHNDTNQAELKAEPEKSQSRYNLRRRKDDPAVEPAPPEEEPEAEQTEAEQTEAPPPAGSPPLDFGGRIGAYLWLLFLPSWVLFVVLQVNLEDPSLIHFPPPLPPLEAFWDPQALVLVLLWVLFQALLYLLPVGKLSEGMPLRSGERLKYRTNGFFAIVVSGVAVAAAVHQGADLSYIHSHFLQLAAASFLLSLLLSVYLYARSRHAPTPERALGGNSGSLMYDFFKGRELNPRIGTFDLKFFCEMRPGLIGWCVINASLAVAEMRLQGLSSPSPAMLLVNAFQLLYVVDGLWNEEAILTTMDLMHDGFGFMLAFGDLVWVPFTYSLQAYYLVEHPHGLGPPALLAILTLKLLGFYIFRQSNSQKNSFRRNPAAASLANMKSIPTATGKSLLVSGWWGVVRHPNYLGDLIMALAWSLPCGFGHLLPWYYMVFTSVCVCVGFGHLLPWYYMVFTSVCVCVCRFRPPVAMVLHGVYLCVCVCVCRFLPPVAMVLHGVYLCVCVCWFRPPVAMVLHGVYLYVCVCVCV
ncbi:delta(14)-sterol reductase LBR isoform X3 [Gadus morhua]|uniref:delta(14)-sterol reductase LBR isoform X3 n=1 Tax=Gadus morhua TaxID=8049 RepID=UPI0011B36CE8|nr:delta(14)-sterol reductase-like isoform X3 [Gadus morhua]